jgi:hypothetical protein
MVAASHFQLQAADRGRRPAWPHSIHLQSPRFGKNILVWHPSCSVAPLHTLQPRHKFTEADQRAARVSLFAVEMRTQLGLMLRLVYASQTRRKLDAPRPR